MYLRLCSSLHESNWKQRFVHCSFAHWSLLWDKLEWEWKDQSIWQPLATETLQCQENINVFVHLCKGGDELGELFQQRSVQKNELSRPVTATLNLKEYQKQHAHIITIALPTKTTIPLSPKSFCWAYLSRRSIHIQTFSVLLWFPLLNVNYAQWFPFDWCRASVCLIYSIV